MARWATTDVGGSDTTEQTLDYCRASANVSCSLSSYDSGRGESIRGEYIPICDIVNGVRGLSIRYSVFWLTSGQETWYSAPYSVPTGWTVVGEPCVATLASGTGLSRGVIGAVVFVIDEIEGTGRKLILGHNYPGTSADHDWSFQELDIATKTTMSASARISGAGEVSLWTIAYGRHDGVDNNIYLYGYNPDFTSVSLSPKYVISDSTAKINHVLDELPFLQNDPYNGAGYPLVTWVQHWSDGKTYPGYAQNRLAGSWTYTSTRYTATSFTIESTLQVAVLCYNQSGTYRTYLIFNHLDETNGTSGIWVATRTTDGGSFTTTPHVVAIRDGGGAFDAAAKSTLDRAGLKLVGANWSYSDYYYISVTDTVLQGAFDMRLRGIWNGSHPNFDQYNVRVNFYDGNSDDLLAWKYESYGSSRVYVKLRDKAAGTVVVGTPREYRDVDAVGLGTTTGFISPWNTSIGRSSNILYSPIVVMGIGINDEVEVSRSVSGGVSWAASTFLSDLVGAQTGNVVSDPTTGRLFYASSDGTTLNIVMSTNGGLTWTTLLADMLASKPGNLDCNYLPISCGFVDGKVCVWYLDTNWTKLGFVTVDAETGIVSDSVLALDLSATTEYIGNQSPCVRDSQGVLHFVHASYDINQYSGVQTYSNGTLSAFSYWFNEFTEVDAAYLAVDPVDGQIECILLMYRDDIPTNFFIGRKYKSVGGAWADGAALTESDPLVMPSAYPDIHGFYISADRKRHVIYKEFYSQDSVNLNYYPTVYHKVYSSSWVLESTTVVGGNYSYSATAFSSNDGGYDPLLRPLSGPAFAFYTGSESKFVSASALDPGLMPYPVSGRISLELSIQSDPPVTIEVTSDEPKTAGQEDPITDFEPDLFKTGHERIQYRRLSVKNISGTLIYAVRVKVGPYPNIHGTITFSNAVEGDNLSDALNYTFTDSVYLTHIDDQDSQAVWVKWAAPTPLVPASYTTAYIEFEVG